MPLLALLWLTACTPQEDETTHPPPLPAPQDLTWERPVVDLSLEHGFFDDHPALANLSLFRSRFDGPSDTRPDQQHRGSLGVGNGHIFALVGLTDPLNTLHSLTGPIYHRGPRFFGDFGFTLALDGDDAPFDTEWIGRPRHLPAVVTRADAGSVHLLTVDVAPIPQGADPHEVPPLVLRHLLLRNDGSGPVDASVRLTAFDPWILGEDGVLRTPLDDVDPREAGLWSPDAPWVENDETFALSAGTLAPGEEAHLRLWVAVGANPAHLTAVLADAEEADADAWLADTLAWWERFAARGTQVEVDDPWLTDFLDGLRVMVRVQQSAGGGVVPLSRYTGTWLRDTIGPVRFYTRLGLFDEAQAALEYLHDCHRERGDYGNSCGSGQRPQDIVREVDWDALPPFTGRVAAEGPSYVALAWWELSRWSGSSDRALALWPYLRRSMLAQKIEDGLQPWSGDETFRMAMNVVLGMPVEVPWEDIAFSSNSSFLYLAAARALASIADEHHPEDATTLRARADEVERALIDTFTQPEGHFSAVHFRDPERDPNPLPFEDANLNAIWSRAFAPDDPVALANLEGLRVFAGQGDGTIQSPPDPQYQVNPSFQSGFATGMLPGFTLFNFAETGDAEHPLAFREVLRYASPTGHFDEGLLYGDRIAFQPVYDRSGRTGDVAARYRPWESGIVGDAVLSYLVGAEPIAGGLRVRPRLTAGDAMRVGPILAGDAVAELSVRWKDEGWQVFVESLADAPFKIQIELPLGVWEDVAWTAEGSGEAPTLEILPGGERMLVFPPEEVIPRQSAWIRVERP